MQLGESVAGNDESVLDVSMTLSLSLPGSPNTAFHAAPPNRCSSVTYPNDTHELGARHGLFAVFDDDETRMDTELKEAVERCRLLELESRRPTFVDLKPVSCAGTQEASPNLVLDGCRVLDDAERILADPDDSSAFRAPPARNQKDWPSFSSSTEEKAENRTALDFSTDAVDSIDVPASVPLDGKSAFAESTKCALSEQSQDIRKLLEKIDSDGKGMDELLRNSSLLVCEVYRSCVLNLAWLCSKLSSEYAVKPAEYVLAFAHDQGSVSLVPAVDPSADAVALHSTVLCGFYCDPEMYNQALNSFRELLGTPELAQLRSEFFVRILTEDVIRVQSLVKDWSKPVSKEQLSRVASAISTSV
eukprot:CAMPEP_0182450410 /NCGR_PEP_ID=MMETSP1172-20130603/41139_1 /TAXON_ID=708627 /ORGANISM="Timspurckia oligopyrenoides, Strain CCMP3278" /LENGTH=359 /DNA_ID=CAMNT_0024648013 /DNA_START=476 /DNA_END=1555 /DNA_ORIENTATION=-